MLRRLVRLSTLTVAGLAALIAVTVPASASGSHVTPRATTAHTASTIVRHVRPVTATGKLRHGYTVNHRYGKAHCVYGSEATGNAYRCFTKNLVIDPCWVTNHKKFVVCLPNGASRKVARLHVTKGYDNTDFGSAHATYPWTVRQLDGTVCTWIQGASGTVRGKRISYGCTKRTVLIGNVDKKSALWHIQKARSTNGGHYRVTGRVQLRKAWFGKPTLKG